MVSCCCFSREGGFSCPEPRTLFKGALASVVIGSIALVVLENVALSAAAATAFTAIAYVGFIVGGLAFITAIFLICCGNCNEFIQQDPDLVEARLELERTERQCRENTLRRQRELEQQTALHQQISARNEALRQQERTRWELERQQNETQRALERQQLVEQELALEQQLVALPDKALALRIHEQFQRQKKNTRMLTSQNNTPGIAPDKTTNVIQQNVEADQKIQQEMRGGEKGLKQIDEALAKVQDPTIRARLQKARQSYIETSDHVHENLGQIAASQGFPFEQES